MPSTVTVVATRRWWVLASIGICVTAMHLLALVALGPGWLDPEGPEVEALPQRFELRSVVQAGQGTAQPSQTAAAVPLAPRHDTRTLLAELPRVQRSASPPATVEVAAAQPSTEGAPADANSATEDAGQGRAVTEVPVYATRLPPAGLWRYRLQRGPMVGVAELRWSPQGNARYEMQLTGRVAGVTMLEWASQGQLDAAGVAPERLAIRRRGRDQQAVNFQREAGKITFSGPTHELSLWPGAQDRLSWMLQLPAVVAAAPERYGAGASVVLFVAGARGDADIWTFVVQGVETLDERPTLKLVREPRRRYDTRAEVWLDPADHFAPLRLVQTPTGGGAALELHRERAVP